MLGWQVSTAALKFGCILTTDVRRSRWRQNRHHKHPPLTCVPAFPCALKYSRQQGLEGHGLQGRPLAPAPQDRRSGIRPSGTGAAHVVLPLLVQAGENPLTRQSSSQPVKPRQHQTFSLLTNGAVVVSLSEFPFEVLLFLVSVLARGDYCRWASKFTR